METLKKEIGTFHNDKRQWEVITNPNVYVPINIALRYMFMYIYALWIYIYISILNYCYRF